jgi:hypothetical protein
MATFLLLERYLANVSICSMLVLFESWSSWRLAQCDFHSYEYSHSSGGTTQGLYGTTRCAAAGHRRQTDVQFLNPVCQLTLMRQQRHFQNPQKRKKLVFSMGIMKDFY